MGIADMETDGVRDEFILDCTGKEKRVEKNLGGKTPESVNGSGQGIFFGISLHGSSMNGIWV